MFKVLYAFKSIFLLFLLYFKKVNPTIVFYYPKHFNRGIKGENEFLQPLINSCLNNKIPFLVFEEPSNTKTPYNPSAIPFDFIFYLVLLLRKIIPNKKFTNLESKEWYIGSKLRPIFLANIEPKIIIIMSNSMAGFFRGCWKNVRLYDYQHGIVYSSHPGYIYNDTIPPHIKINASKLMLFGEGFKKLLTKGNNKYFDLNSSIIGIAIQYQFLHTVFNRSILISFPFVSKNEVSNSQNLAINQLENLFHLNQDYYFENKILFYLKLHPRFDFTFDLGIFLRYPFIIIINKTLLDCFTKCSLHITQNSTITFDAAVFGIPTLFLEDSEDNLIFDKEFKYPNFYSNTQIQKNIKVFIDTPSLYRKAVLDVQNWVKDYYQPYNEIEFLKIVNEKD